MKDRSEQPDIRLAIIGAPHVGKSAIAVRFLTRRFISEYEPDVEFVYRREIKFEDDFISFELKDTAGGACLSSAFAFFNWASSIIVVYSIVERSTFITAAVVLEELRRIQRSSQKSSPTFSILANKQDVCHRREVGTEEGRKLALKHGASFYEVSAAQDYDNIFIPLNTLIVQNFIRSAKDGFAEEHSHEIIEKRPNVQLPLIAESPGYDKNLSGKKSPSERKQTVRRKISAAIFKKRSETV